MYTVATYLIARYCSVIVLIYYVDLFAEYLLACIADHDFYNIIRSTANIHYVSGIYFGTTCDMQQPCDMHIIITLLYRPNPNTLVTPQFYIMFMPNRNTLFHEVHIMSHNI